MQYDPAQLRETLGRFQSHVHQTAINKGWWDVIRQDGTLIALMHSELSEALEALRRGEEEALGEELADVIIRILDYAETKGIDMAECLIAKATKNEGRPHLHGGRRF